MTKRRFLIMVLFAFVGIQAFAEQIDQKQAVQIAVEFMNQKAEKSSSFQKMKDGEMVVSHVIKSQMGEPDIYILNAREKGKGFVILSGDTQTGDAVLGYSDTGEFDYENAPANAKAWVDGYAKGIEAMRLQGNAGERKKAHSSEIIEPLLSTQWDQWSPFNDLCPNACPTGCVATAMAQVMKYWNWPEQGQGYHINECDSSQVVDFSQSHYDWDNMLDKYYERISSISNDSKKAVAKLMYDCGCSVNTMYYSNESGSVFADASAVLFWYFKYKECSYVQRKSYRGDWEEMLLNELHEGRPVLYAGNKGDEGCVSHAFVCDGYAGDGYFHFNFGWSGISDGNFKLDEEFPFEDSQIAIIGICPDYEMTTIVVNGCLYQKIDENNVRLSSCIDKKLKTVITPESIEIDGKNYVVTEIGNYAFENCYDLTSITIPNSVTTIGDCAFYNCRGLSTLTIPTSVITIGKSAFKGCSGITSITIPNSVTTIGESAFMWCSGLTEVTIPNSVTTIGRWAFEYCSGLTEVTIPNSVTTIGSWAFWSCPIEKLVWDSNMSPYAVTETCGESLKEVVIGPNVTTIGEEAFYSCSSLTNLTISNSVTTIGEYAFENCTSLTTVTIPNSVTTIGDCAFSGCSGIISVTIGNSVTTIGGQAFENCSSLKYLTIPNSVTTIGNYFTFSGCSSLEKLVWDSNISPNSVTRFCGESLKEVILGQNMTIIGASAFSGCSGLTSITIPNSVTSIGAGVFDGCPLEKVVWDSSASPSFSNNKSLKEVVFGSNVTTIGDWAFFGCSGLTSITIPNSVTTIGYGAFENCSNLTDITIPNSVTTIGQEAFYGCTGLTNLMIPNSVTTIGDGAFWSCSGLTSMTIPNSVTTIGNFVFYQCTGLTKIMIPNSVTSIGIHAFYSCSRLTSIVIPNSVTTIEADAFNSCTLNEVYISWDTPIETGWLGANYYGTLYVPIGTKALYAATFPWSMFHEIKEYDVVGIENVKMDEAQSEKRYYNLNGQRVNNATNGIFILNGKKILIK